MEFLVDVNASRTLADWLAALGHDTALVVEVDPRMSDYDILDWAVREDRIVVTTDVDFEELIWRQGRIHRGVLRLENLPRSQRHDLLQSVLSQHGDDLAAGAIVIAGLKKIRVRYRP